MSDFFGQQGVGTWPGPERTRPSGLHEEWGIKVHGNNAVILSYDSYASAIRTLTHQRKDLARLGIPEDYWPVLVSRTVETTVGSWRYHGE
jgi:hypothetical protein